MDLLKQRIGRTVLYKTSKLNQLIGKGELFLKMEGLNPTGKIQDRIAYYLVKEAIQLGFKVITVASSGALGESLAFISEAFKLECKVVMPENSVAKKKKWYKEANVEIIEFGRTYTDAFKRSKTLALENGWYDANHGYDNTSITDSVYSEIAEEIVAKLGTHPDFIICFLSNGALVTALHMGFRMLWRKGIINRIPTIVVVCVGKDNPIYKAYSMGDRIIDKSALMNRYKGSSKNNVEYAVLEPQSVLNAIYDSGGTIVTVEIEAIKSMISKVKQTENLKTYFRGGASLAAFEYICANGMVSEDAKTVTILEAGQNELTIKPLAEDDFENVGQLADYVMKYLGPYGDDKESTIETIECAFKNGFVLGAYISGKLKGLAVVIQMPVKIVMPQYHLVYIGADISAGSRGIGTRLMEEVRIVTEGNFSLHVDVDNKKAIKLYEKMGIKRCYFRMIAQKETPTNTKTFFNKPDNPEKKS